MGPVQLDLFVSRLTTQCRCYFSWQPDPYAEATNAFLQDWSQVSSYASPPWNLVGRVLAQVQSQRAQVVLVASVWKTTVVSSSALNAGSTTLPDQSGTGGHSSPATASAGHTASHLEHLR